MAANRIANLMAQLEKLPGLEAANERLRGEIEGLRGDNGELRGELERLRAENEELRTKLGMNSPNSSMPPSRDDSEARGKRRKKARSAKHARAASERGATKEPSAAQ